MDKSEGKDWFAKTLNSVTEETAKVYRISSIKLEVASLNRTQNEKVESMQVKLMRLIDDGAIDSGLFEPEYSGIKSIEAKKDTLREESESIKKNIKIGFPKSSKTSSASSKPYSKENIASKEDKDKNISDKE